jgi:S-adenosylmethionine hydrolase
MQRLVTLTTDFGVHDHYVGAMKGVLLNINPEAHIVDICNSVQSYDVLDGALTIAQAYPYYPPGTVHVVVVDPGVGTARRPLLVTTGKHIFLAPDNGVLSFVFEREERLSVRHITSDHYFAQPVSRTFHGRDIFAAVAGYLSKGVEQVKFGDEITDFTRFAAPRPKATGDDSMKGVVLKADKFGNLITNLTPADLPRLFAVPPAQFTLTVGKAEIKTMRTAYAEGAQGELFAILGSTGYLEIATHRGSAARLAAADKGSEVSVTLGGM